MRWGPESRSPGGRGVPAAARPVRPCHFPVEYVSGTSDPGGETRTYPCIS